MISVSGFCPYGCGKTLFLGSGNYITCSYAHCPNPTGVADLLEEDAAVTEHIVQLDDYSFTIHHPLRERIDGSLFGCQLHHDLGSMKLAGGPFRKGTYKVSGLSPKWHFEEVEDS